jgi:hypothetical protein
VKLSDVMSHANLAVYAEVALVLFMLVFVGVVLEVLFFDERRGRAELLPLEDDLVPNDPERDAS